MKLLIHACCADCLLKMVESIKTENKFEEIEVYYYNPNIHPRSEYQSRLKAMQLMIGDLKMIIPDWKPSEWFNCLKPTLPSLEKGGLKKADRCPKCWELRLEETAEYAKKNGFDCFTSTLLTSEYQNSEMIEKIGKEIGKKYKINFFIPENICKKLETKGFYKQVFCGCCYSLTERFEEKFG
ncbi:MAG: epoxyqueuosine reductase QueH [Candidatus Shapirobacteria bacterium]|nr:epoxyqueuosine reductase QueH [Candidatus Shapirobacteria bacterium]MDD4410158.1 epoxyqueuosine reductase QueH [Candidatus Shapirobacteria bacterium]